MHTEDHEFQISKEELACLKNIVHDRSLVSLLDRSQAIGAGKATVRLTRAEAERLRTCLTERLAATGFERDYSLTEKGRMLEELIDRFYLA